MRAAIYRQFQGDISIEDVPIPLHKDHGVVIRVTASGLCRSDWHGWMGHDKDIVLPHVPGHELAGVIEETGANVQHFFPGQRVTVPFVCGCGSCPQCSSGNHQVCDHQTQPGFTHWGSFAEYVVIDNADVNLVTLPDEIDDITAATLGCRFVTSFRAVVDQGKVEEGQYVVVHGCGGIGLSAIMIAHAKGANVVAIDINDQSLDLASKLGASEVINSRYSTSLIAEISSLTNGGAHLSIDALGSIETCLHSISCLRKRGKHIQVGLMNELEPNIPMNLVMSNELELIGSHGMQAYKYGGMMELILEGKLNPSLLISKTISLDDIKKELPAMNQFSNSGIVVVDSFQ